MSTIMLQCPACGWEYSADEGYFACPRAGDGREHILAKHLDAGPEMAEETLELWREHRTDPLAAFAHLGAVAGVALGHAQRAARLQEKLALHEGHPLGVTPLRPLPELARALGHTGMLAAKDETGQVGGSHKVRHLAGTMLYVEALRALNGGGEKRPLAISSCGNAALAAACVARAAGYGLTAYVPEDVHPEVAAKLRERGATVEIVARLGTGGGDPCYLAFCAAVRKGAIPFSCSGRDNWTNIEGGQSLGYEAALQWLEAGAAPDHLVLQVGGGALARSVAQAFEELHAMAVLPFMPQVHVCQTEGAFPLVRAYYLMLTDIALAAGLPWEFVYSKTSAPGAALKSLIAFQNIGQAQVAGVAVYACEHFMGKVVQSVLRRAVDQPGRYLWAWDGPAPHSLAHGILDDETYDWFFLLRSLLRSGGQAVVLGESLIARAYAMALGKTPMDVSATGSAGLAGLLALRDLGTIPATARVGLFFTGCNR